MKSTLFYFAFAAAVVSAGINLLAVFFAPTFQFPVQLTLGTTDSATILAGIGGAFVGSISAGAINWYFSRKAIQEAERVEATNILMSVVEIQNDADTVLLSIEHYRTRSLDNPAAATWVSIPPLALTQPVTMQPYAAALFIKIGEGNLASRFSWLAKSSLSINAGFSEILRMRSELESMTEFKRDDGNGIITSVVKPGLENRAMLIKMKIDAQAPRAVQEYENLRREARTLATDISKTFRVRYGPKRFPGVRFPEVSLAERGRDEKNRPIDTLKSHP